MMWITIDEGPDSGKPIEFTGETFTIGRHPESDLVLTDPEASSHHAAIETDADGKLSLRDLTSTNGTFVDGKKIDGAVPITGDEKVRIGKNTIRLSLRSPDATVIATEPPARPEPTAPPAPRAPQPTRPVPTAPEVLPAPGVPAAAAVRTAPFQPSSGGYGSKSGGSNRTGWIVAGVLALLIIAGGVVAIVASSGGSSTLTTQQLITQASPSVVRIEGDQGGGSGFIINAKQQLILTNAHVVEGNSALNVQVGNNASNTSPARIVAADPCDDLAVLKLVTPISGLKALPFGSSGAVHAGDPVTVLGFPGALRTPVGNETTAQSATIIANTGTVSEVDVKANPDPSLPEYQDTIVHQAPVNHGDSGGPLLNRSGQVVGVNTLVNESNQGQYYSIAIDYVKRLLPGLEAGQDRDALGWSLFALSDTDPNLATTLQSLYANNPAFASNATQLAADTTKLLQAGSINGVLDLNDQPGSAADKASAAGFLFDSMNGDPTPTVAAVCNIVTSVNPGSQVKLHGFNVDAGSDPTRLSGELARAGTNPVFTGTLTVPSH